MLDTSKLTLFFSSPSEMVNICKAHAARARRAVSSCGLVGDGLQLPRKGTQWGVQRLTFKGAT